MNVCQKVKMKKISPIPMYPDLGELGPRLEALREETFLACSIPYALLKGVPSKTPTATQVEMLVRNQVSQLRNKLIDNMTLVKQ